MISANGINFDLETKGNYCIPCNKRLYETDDRYPDKRIKTEDDNCVKSSEAQVPEAIPSSSSTRPRYGVKRIAPCPPECRPSHRDFALYREQLVKKVIDDLAGEGKRVEGHVRFLDDGIIFDWALESVSVHPEIVSSKTDLNKPDFSSSSAALLNGEDHPSEHLTTIGSRDNPIDIADDDDPHMKQSVTIRSTNPGSGVFLSRPSLAASSTMIPVSSIQALGSYAPSNPIQRSEDCSGIHHSVGIHGDVFTNPPSLLEASTIPSVESVELSIPPTSNHIALGFPSSLDLGRTPVPALNNISQPSVTVASLRDIDWANYESILILKRVPPEVMSDPEPIFTYFERNAIPRTHILRIMFHKIKGTRHIVTSVQFCNPQSALNALCVKDRAFCYPLQGREYYILINIERCQSRNGSKVTQGNVHLATSGAQSLSALVVQAHQIGTHITAKRNPVPAPYPLESKISRNGDGFTADNSSNCQVVNRSDATTVERVGDDVQSAEGLFEEPIERSTSICGPEITSTCRVSGAEHFEAQEQVPSLSATESTAMAYVTEMPPMQGDRLLFPNEVKQHEEQSFDFDDTYSPGRDLADDRSETSLESEMYELQDLLVHVRDTLNNSTGVNEGQTPPPQSSMSETRARKYDVATTSSPLVIHTMKDVDWRSSQSIIFLKRLPATSDVTAIYDFFQRHGFPFSSIAKILCHRYPGGGLYASVQFSNSQLANAATEIKDLKFYPDPGKSHIVKIELCRLLPQQTIPSAANQKPLTNANSAQLLSEVITPSPGLHLPGQGEHSDKLLQNTDQVTSLNKNPKPCTPHDVKEFSDSEGALSSSHSADGDEPTHPTKPLSSRMPNIDSESSGDTSSSDAASDSSGEEEEPDVPTSARLKLPLASASNSRPTSAPIPKAMYGRARRMVMLPDKLLATVSMRGDVQFVHSGLRRRLAALSLPADSGDYSRIVDACSSGNTGIMAGRGADGKISFIVATQHEASIRKVNSDVYRDEICSIAPLEGEEPYFSFLTGSETGSVARWRVSHQDGNFSSVVDPLYQLASKSAIHALAFRKQKGDALCSAGIKVWMSDLNLGAVLQKTAMSNTVNQIHIHPQDDNIVIFETSHLDEQVQIYDTRRHLFDRAPSAIFGYRDTANSKLVRSKYRKGACQHSYFARGFQDGTVVVWDYRKVKTPLIKSKQQLNSPVWHTLFMEGSRTLVSFNEHSVNFLDLAK